MSPPTGVIRSNVSPAVPTPVTPPIPPNVPAPSVTNGLATASVRPLESATRQNTVWSKLATLARSLIPLLETPKDDREIQYAESGTMAAMILPMLLSSVEFSPSVSCLAGLATYVGSGLMIRLLNFFHKGDDDERINFTQPRPVRELAFEPGVAQDSLHTLHEQLLHEKKMLCFLGIAERDFSYEKLVDALENVRIKSVQEGQRSKGYRGYFRASDKTVSTGEYSKYRVVHELCHFLHFEALINNMDSSEIHRVYNFYQGLKDHGYIFSEPEMEDCFQTVTGYVEQPHEGRPSLAVRDSAAQLFWGLDLHIPNVGAKLEAVASRFDINIGGIKMAAMAASGNVTMLAIKPMAMIGGFHTTNQSLTSQHGYSNPFLYTQVLQEGLFRSLLPATDENS